MCFVCVCFARPAVFDGEFVEVCFMCVCVFRALLFRVRIY